MAVRTREEKARGVCGAGRCRAVQGPRRSTAVPGAPGSWSRAGAWGPRAESAGVIRSSRERLGWSERAHGGRWVTKVKVTPRASGAIII